MKFFSWLPIAVLSIAAVYAEEAKEPLSELQIETTFMPESCPNKAQAGDRLKVHYTGTLFSNGKKFDSSLDRGQPFSLALGSGQVIKGWEEGLKGMCLNEKRTLTIPAHLAYGSRGFGSGIIPPNSALIFTCELVGLETAGREEL